MSLRRTGFKRPTGAKLEAALQRQREQREASVRRSQEKQRSNRKLPDVGKSRKGIPRKKRVRPVNPERRARLFVRNYHSEAFVGWIHSLACSVSGKEGWEGDPIVAAHVRGKGAGGDWTMVIPMLQSLHDELHRAGHRTFQRTHRVDLELIAAAVHQRWVAFAGGAE